MPRKDRGKIICCANNAIDETATKGDHISWKTLVCKPEPVTVQKKELIEFVDEHQAVCSFFFG